MVIDRDEAAKRQAVNPVKNLRSIGSSPVLQDIAVGMLLGQAFVVGQRFLGFQKLIWIRSYLFIRGNLLKIRR